MFKLQGQEKPGMGCFSGIWHGSCRVQGVVLCCDFSMTNSLPSSNFVVVYMPVKDVNKVKIVCVF